MFTFTKHKEKPVNLVNNGNGLAGLALWFVLTTTNIIHRKYTQFVIRMVWNGTMRSSYLAKNADDRPVYR